MEKMIEEVSSAIAWRGMDVKDVGGIVISLRHLPHHGLHRGDVMCEFSISASILAEMWNGLVSNKDVADQIKKDPLKKRVGYCDTETLSVKIGECFSIRSRA